MLWSRTYVMWFTFIKLNLLLQIVIVFCTALWHCTIVFVFFLMIMEFSCFREDVFVESRCCKMSLTVFKWMAYYVSMIQMLAMKLLPWSLLSSVFSDYDVVCVETISLKGQAVCALDFLKWEIESSTHVCKWKSWKLWWVKSKTMNQSEHLFVPEMIMMHRHRSN